jgi:phosphatidylglycerol lysyltransferase
MRWHTGCGCASLVDVAIGRQFPGPLEHARELVNACGWNATSYQILNTGIRHWFSKAPPAVVGYTRRHDVLLVAGVPVCEAKVLNVVCEKFEAFAQRSGCRVCYVCAEERPRNILTSSRRHAAIVLGAQPVWNPRTWSDIVRSRASLRAQLHRARNKGVIVEPMASGPAAGDPELRSILDQWVRARPLPPLHFLAKPDIFAGVMADRRVLVARRRGKAVAFLVASPVKARKGCLVELLARSSAAPNGSSELLIDTAMRLLAGEGSEYVTLGLVALAHANDAEIRGNPAWLRPLMYFARAHANRFYNFQGIEHFRLKMAPDRWEPVYAISNERHFSPGTLYAMGAAFSGIPPWAAIAIGIAKAGRDELRRLARAAQVARSLPAALLRSGDRSPRPSCDSFSSTRIPPTNLDL